MGGAIGGVCTGISRSSIAQPVKLRGTGTRDGNAPRARARARAPQPPPPPPPGRPTSRAPCGTARACRTPAPQAAPPPRCPRSARPRRGWEGREEGKWRDRQPRFAIPDRRAPSQAIDRAALAESPSTRGRPARAAPCALPLTSTDGHAAGSAEQDALWGGKRREREALRRRSPERLSAAAGALTQPRQRRTRRRRRPAAAAGGAAAAAPRLADQGTGPADASMAGRRTEARLRRARRLRPDTADRSRPEVHSTGQRESGGFGDETGVRHK